MTFPYHQTLKGEMPEHIDPWLFQPGHFEMPLVIFSALPVKYKPAKISSKCYVTKSSK